MTLALLHSPSLLALTSFLQEASAVGGAKILAQLTVFILAIFLGFELITKVPPTLHTPLMSGANAISGITLVGALLCFRVENPGLANVLGFLAIACATINVVGGFLVTDRMLKMFGKR